MEENTTIGRPPGISKYKIKYGKSLREIAKIFGVSTVTIHNWLEIPSKKKWLEEELEKMEGE